MRDLLIWPIAATGFLIGTTIIVTLMVIDAHIRG